MKYIKAFGMFWWEFFIGDTPELFVGMLAILAVGWLTSGTTFAFVALPAATILVLGISIARNVRTR